MPARKDIEPGIYAVERPVGFALPLILDSPHSGRDYPHDFRPRPSRDALREAEDSNIDQLFEGAPRQGAILLSALFPRVFIDPNRAVDDIDPVLLDRAWPGAHPTARSRAGIGLIRRLLKPGERLYDRMLTPMEIRSRIDNFYLPYHAKLRRLLTDAHVEFGGVWHLDCHAMPAHQPADIVLGDRDGTSCAPEFTHAVREMLSGAGFKVACNDPYKGVEILKRHGCPAENRHSLQIEINKGLYWDDRRQAPGAGFESMRRQMESLTRDVATFVKDALRSQLAAD